MKKKPLILLSIFILSLTLISCNKNTIEIKDSPDNNTEINTEKPEVPNSNNNDLQIENSNKLTPPNSDISQKETKSVRLYFYDVVNDTIIYYDDTIQVTDKAVTNALINALKNPSNASVTPSIPKSINVTSAKLDINTNTFTIDFPNNFVSEMNLGSGPESSTLQSIVNTLGYNFNVDNVIITLGGKPYSSGHIIMESGESFKVSLNNTINLNN